MPITNGHKGPLQTSDWFGSIDPSGGHMAYSDSTGDNARLLKRTVTAVADFSGRSRRTEVIYYWIATGLVGVVLHFAVSMVASLEASMLFEQ